MLKEIERAFFQGIFAGWVHGEEGHRNLLNWHTVEYHEVIWEYHLNFRAPISVIDRWGNDPASGKPSGSTFITVADTPAWVMWYGGDSYNEDVLPFLREALIENYRENKFCGGRGPATYRKGNLLYTNKFEGDFLHFSGHEYIEYVRDNEEKQNAGSHKYWGGSLLYLK
ncbi:MAG TPA: DUF5680 domain-containing protein [Candidatus Paceibacterota bacterium]|nr:DUF5680 domain-containing protein [Candidatus Paceibacterota bacterium]